MTLLKRYNVCMTRWTRRRRWRRSHKLVGDGQLLLLLLLLQLLQLVDQDLHLLVRSNPYSLLALLPLARLRLEAL